MLNLISVLLTALLGLSACSGVRVAEPRQGVNQPAQVKENHKYHLACVFHSEEIGGARVVISVSIQDRRTGEVVVFKPLDGESLTLNEGFYKNVAWSPDEEYLLLPLGRFEGFGVVKSADALQSVRNHSYEDFIRVQLDTDTKLWHDLDKWDGSTSFVFKAGMSGSFPGFKYDVTTKKLNAVEKVSDIFIGYNKNGKVPVGPPQ
jgi:hypothetical protein